jgi:hypothetical protein
MTGSTGRGRYASGAMGVKRRDDTTRATSLTGAPRRAPTTSRGRREGGVALPSEGVRRVIGERQSLRRVARAPEHYRLPGASRDLDAASLRRYVSATFA